MKTFNKLKTAIQNTPPERLAKIEYRSHFYQMLGVLFVCSILVYRGYWYIIFAFIFSLGISYSQGVSAYQRYNFINNVRKKHVWEMHPEKDKSPSRKRDAIIKEVFGGSAWWACIVGSLVLTYLLIGYATWYQKLSFAMFLILFQVILYFFIMYWIAYPFYKYKNKEVKK